MDRVAEDARFVLKRAQRDGWYRAVGKFPTLVDASEVAAQSTGLYQVERLNADGTMDREYQPVTIRTAWFPTTREKRAVIVDPNKPVSPAMQERYDALYAESEVA